jgi:hypothetical protein
MNGRNRCFLSFRALLKVFAKIDNPLRHLSFSKYHATSLREYQHESFRPHVTTQQGLCRSAVLPRALPNVRAIIIGCADMRVDPAYVFGMKPGEAVVMRNIGGRITPGLLEQLGLLARIGEVAGEIPGGGGEFHIVILQHTDCGITRLAGDTEMLTRYLLEGLPINHPSVNLPIGSRRFPRRSRFLRLLYAPSMPVGGTKCAAHKNI